MAGHVKQVSRGRFRVVVEAGKDPATGKRKRIVRYVKGRKGEAEEVLAQLMTELAKGTYIEPAKMTVAEYLDHWLKTAAKMAVRPITFESYESQIRNHIKPLLGAIQLSQLTPMHIQNFFAQQLENNLSLRSIQYQHAILRKALNDAVYTQQLTKNVAALVTPPKQKMNETHVKDERARALTPEETDRLLDAAKGRRHYHLIQIAIKTGLRRGELLGLRWEDVDLENQYLSVRQTLEKVEGILGFQAPKTEKSMRTIPFVESCIPIFEEIKKVQAKDRLYCKEKKKRYHDLGLVFCQRNGTMQDPGNVTKQVGKLLDKAGIKNATLHSLRHTFASNLIARGVPLEQVQVLLGHDSISTTANIYAHILPGVLEETMAKLAGL